LTRDCRCGALDAAADIVAQALLQRSKPMLLRWIPGLLLVALAAGCSGPVGGGESRKAALTLENGVRYLVKIDGDRVVLRRKVGEHYLPFDDKAFVGKNIVVYPSTVAGDDGIFARVTAIEPAADTITLRVRALQLDELAQAAKDGDDTLTIDRNPAVMRSLPATLEGANHPTGSITPQSLDLNLSLGLKTEGDSSGQPTVDWPPILGMSAGLTSNLIGAASATFDESDFSFTPGLTAKWVDDGIQLGADMKLSAKFTATLRATALATAPIYETVEKQNLLVLVKGGPVTLFSAPVMVAGVYTTIEVRAQLGCYGRVEGRVAGKLSVDLGAGLSGSAAIKLGSGDGLVSEGDIPFSATGHADASFEPEDASVSPSVYCEVPRVGVYLQPGGKIAQKLGGPSVYAAVVGKAYAAWDTEPNFKVQAVVGVTAEPLGHAIGAEATLLTWKP
jgi:hypothetical protein